MDAGIGGMSWTTRLALGTTTSLGAFAGAVGKGAHAMDSAAARHAAAASRAGRIGNGDIGMKRAPPRWRRPHCRASARDAARRRARSSGESGRGLLDAGDRPLAAA